MEYILGLDLGARSLGWAAVAVRGDDEDRLLGAGVRIFEAGMEGNLERGQEESRAVQRRTARLQRRGTRRRRDRARRLYRLLAEAGLLPALPETGVQPQARSIQTALNGLDGALRAKYSTETNVDQLPYLLRARALDHTLEAYELGRALYHLNQRRGFQSNAKALAKDDEERGKVYAGIAELRSRLEGKRTLGEYFAACDPHEARIRNRYTHRSMYRHEFARIWEAQQPHHAALTGSLRASLEALMFDQRPLQSKEDEIGQCEWIPEEKRAPAWSMEFQRFRLLQNVAHVRVRDVTGRETALTGLQRTALIEELERRSELTFKAARKLLGIPREWSFSIEEGKETRFKGNGVQARMAEHSSGLWERLNGEERHRLLLQTATASNDEALAGLLVEEWGMSREAAETFAAKVTLPAGYCSLSLKAMRAVIPLLEQGLSVQEARKTAGFDIVRRTPVHDELPPVADCVPHGVDVRNPAVIRALTELRKVVNAVIRQWGKPRQIHIELARDLKKNRKQRAEENDRNQKQKGLRGRIRTRIATELGIDAARIGRSMIEKGLLFEECNGHCPYTGQSLGSFASLFNDGARAQVEHIIPRSRCLDDSFHNLTLATVEANREKGNRTPFEAYGANSARYDEILERVRAFAGEPGRRKLKRFLMESTDTLLEEFTQRQLNDTRYTSRVAGDYLALLYGGRNAEGRQKIFNLTGQLTADLRGLWNLNSILSSDGSKSRNDHRHHAIDAVVAAVFRQKWMTLLSSAAEASWQERKRRYASLPPPWVGFKEDVEAAIKAMHVSHRTDHRVTGALHKETLYGVVGKTDTGGDIVRTRKPVHLLKPGDEEKIVDEGVRKAVQAALAAAGGDAAKLENNWPVLPNANGAPVKIKSVRIDLNRSVKQVGRGWKARYAEGGETHHVAVFETAKGKNRIWEGEVVPMSEALQRIRTGQPVVNRRNDEDGKGFLFSLCKNDVLELRGERKGLWVVKKIKMNGQIALTPETDARLEKDRVNFAPTISGLRKLNARKVSIGPLGEVWPSHD
ncbi:MAG: type II CRISPR RNA-guided endonuclease Cas9 [Bryobacterales bacterium]|nr:type II CRISPR RNA-guided endonuclease Cas9 [Bryobacterales bacterium]